MAFSNLDGLYRQVIMDHYKDPVNKGLLTDPTYHNVHLKNPTCGDDITVAIKLQNNTIQDLRHDGVGCSICCSSASVMCQELSGKSTTDARHITNTFYEVVKGAPIDDIIEIGEAVAYSGVSLFPARIKCATIPWKALETGLDELGA